MVNPFVERALQLADRARELHAIEREITSESVWLVGELRRVNAPVQLRMKVPELADFVGLTVSQFSKRSQIARLIAFFPEILEMVERREIYFSHVSVVAGKLTQANSREVLDWMRFRSKRQVELLLPAILPRKIDWSSTTLSPHVLAPYSPGNPHHPDVEFPGELKVEEWSIPRGICVGQHRGGHLDTNTGK